MCKILQQQNSHVKRPTNCTEWSSTKYDKCKNNHWVAVFLSFYKVVAFDPNYFFYQIEYKVSWPPRSNNHGKGGGGSGVGDEEIIM